MICERCRSVDSVGLNGRCGECGHQNRFLFEIHDGTQIRTFSLKKAIEATGYTAREEDQNTFFCKRTDFPGFILTVENHGDSNHPQMPFDYQLVITLPFQVRTREKQQLYQLMMLVLEANYNEAIFASLCLDKGFENLMIKSDCVLTAKVSMFDLVVFIERAIAEAIHFITKSPIGNYLNLNF
jgi:hypothetical protein